jgi:iron complex transport system permease protein
VIAPARPPAAAPQTKRKLPKTTKSAILLAGLVLTLVSILVAVAVGSTSLSVAEVAESVRLAVFGGEVPAGFAKTYTVVIGLRLPRVALATVAGAALSLAGVLMQALLRNPLVSPFTLGVSPAAAFGAALAILLLSGTGAPSFLVALGALITALAVSALVLGLSRTRAASTATLLLLGVAMTQLFEALTSAVQFVADENTLQQIVRWTFGSVNEATWSDVGFVAAILALAIPVAVWNATKLNAVAFAGDDSAKSLGVHVDALRVGLITVAVLLASVVVSVCGVIGFVGLVGPHIARLIIGGDHRFLLPFSVVAGGMLLLVADTVGRTILAPAVIPVGIVVAVVGAPLFINLIISRRKAIG